MRGKPEVDQKLKCVGTELLRKEIFNYFAHLQREGRPTQLSVIIVWDSSVNWSL